MKKSKLFAYIGLFVLALAGTITSLVFFIKSYAYYADEYGTDISFNYDYAILLIVTIMLSVYMGYKLYYYIRFNKLIARNYELAIGETALVSFYSLGVFFKALFKAMSKKKDFDYISNQVYLYCGIFVLALCIFLVIMMFKRRKPMINK
jgi:hypothetical protein